MAKEEPNTFLVTFKGDQLTLVTDRPRKKTLEALLRLMLREWKNVNPDHMDAFIDRINAHHKWVKDKKKPEEPGPEVEEMDFHFWESMMQRVREP
ncbi:hypothetical protein ABEW34_01835 [Paenibacillus algorifonticola]|uniref:hypothetical protein n=1 Tax=Paenibacillus algorifonticola TaxID=684063 RepID=UPI003D2836C4